MTAPESYVNPGVLEVDLGLVVLFVIALYVLYHAVIAGPLERAAQARQEQARREHLRQTDPALYYWTIEHPQRLWDAGYKELVSSQWPQFRPARRSNIAGPARRPAKSTRS